MRSSFSIKAVGFALLSLANAQDVSENLAGAIADYDSLSLFRSLLGAAPQVLVETLSSQGSNVTILIPTNNAIKSYLKDSSISDVTELNQTMLQVFFSYHTMAASLSSTDFDVSRGLSVPTLLKSEEFNNRTAGPQIQSQFGNNADGQVVFASRVGKGKRANGDISGAIVNLRAGEEQNIKMTAVDGSWGEKNASRFQIVDKVLLPPLSCSQTVHAADDKRLTALNGALIKAGLWPALDASKNVTCLAPSTQAFKDAGSPDVELSKDDLSGALLAHTLNEVTYSNYLRDGQVIGTLNKTEVRVRIIDNDIFFNNAKVIEANVLTNNGLIHILDSVIQAGGKPSETSTGTSTAETASATSNGSQTTSSSATASPDNGNSAGRLSIDIRILGVLVAAYAIIYAFPSACVSIPPRGTWTRCKVRTMSMSKVALVTAASSGLGAAIARMLAVDLGMNVVINFNSNESRAKKLVRRLQSECEETHAGSNISIQAIQADTCDKLQIESLVNEAASKFGGRLDVVISNVGWTKMRQFSDLDDNVDEDDWDRCYVANVKSHLWLFHAARRYLEESNEREAGVPVFVSTASLAGVIPSGSSLPYAVTKAAQIHLGKCLAKIAAPSIRVNTISPGILLTEWGLSFPADRLEVARNTNKLGRFATVEDVAEQVKAFVVSKSVTGQNGVIDAGFGL
ncbi:transforming growth factor-beta-induced ig-h3 [Fusarium oxysporum]|nr:transforming growth factor-beta-induced ig-h3 [Fusarium oxysporum]